MGPTRPPVPGSPGSPWSWQQSTLWSKAEQRPNSKHLRKSWAHAERSQTCGIREQASVQQLRVKLVGSACGLKRSGSLRLSCVFHSWHSEFYAFAFSHCHCHCQLVLFSSSNHVAVKLKLDLTIGPACPGDPGWPLSPGRPCTKENFGAWGLCVFY